MSKIIRTIYLYVVSLIALLFILVNAGILINMALQVWVFTSADKANYYYYDYGPQPTSYLVDPNRDVAQALKESPDLTDDQKKQVEQWLADYESYKQKELAPQDRRSAERQRDASRSLAMLLVAIPVFWGHWRLVRKEKE